MTDIGEHIFYGTLANAGADAFFQTTEAQEADRKGAGCDSS